NLAEALRKSFDDAVPGWGASAARSNATWSCGRGIGVAAASGPVERHAPCDGEGLTQDATVSPTRPSAPPSTETDSGSQRLQHHAPGRCHGPPQLPGCAGQDELV